MGPPSGKTYMGWWGHMGVPKQKGITSYAVSPLAQSHYKVFSITLYSIVLEDLSLNFYMY